MINKPALARALVAYDAPDDAVILAGPGGEFLLSGKVYSMVIPLMDGFRTADSIAELLSDRIDPAEVYYALLCLEAERCITEGTGDSAAGSASHFVAAGPEVKETASFVAANDHLLHPISGIARGVKKLLPANLTATHVYIGGANRASNSLRPGDVTRHLRSFVSGKGRSDLLARASLIGETAERHSAVFRGDEQIIRASIADLGDRAVRPNDVMLFSEHQLAMRKDLATEEDPIPRALGENEVINWTPIWSLTEKREKFAPTSLVFFDAPSASGDPYCFADSNGNAAGATREGAMLQGLLELIERDAVGIWWFNAVRRPSVDLSDLEDEWVSEFVAQLSRIQRETWVIDVSTDTGIPVYAAISRRTDQPAEEILFGFGAHPDARTAVLRALTELGQTLAIMGEITGTGAPIRAGLRTWLESATLDRCDFLRPNGCRPIPRDQNIQSPTDAMSVCRAQLETLGVECLVLDQTRRDVGVPVVKMLAPGLRHYRRRFAAGRLYSTPVAIGWLQEPRTEEQLNPLVLAF